MMSQGSEIFLYISILVVMVLLSFGLAILISPKRFGPAQRSIVTGLLTTIVMHAYIVVIENGVDQFVAVSVLMGFFVGFLGGLALEAILKLIRHQKS